VSGVVAEAGAHVNGEDMGWAVVGGERAGDDMGGTRDLTSGPGLPAGERRERERGGAADGWGRAIRRRRGRCWAAWAAGGEGEAGARKGGWGGLGRKWPSRGGSFSFFFFCFLFLISIFYFYLFFISFSFESTIS
jgi:hypothetical protein